MSKKRGHGTSSHHLLLKPVIRKGQNRIAASRDAAALRSIKPPGSYQDRSQLDRCYPIIVLF